MNEDSHTDPAGLLPPDLRIDPGAWIAPGAIVVGRVSLGPDSSVWYGCVLRGDLAPIEIGRGTNVQDLTVVHVDIDRPAVIGDDVTVGHRCVIHGCTVGNGALIGMGAVLLSGCRIGEGALVAAGSVVAENLEVPAGMLAAGVPARVRRRLSSAQRERVRDGARRYRQSLAAYRAGRAGGGPWGGVPGGRR